MSVDMKPKLAISNNTAMRQQKLPSAFNIARTAQTAKAGDGFSLRHK